MRVLIVGSGGREHALAWKLARSPEVDRVWIAPGREAMARDGVPCPDVASDDAAAIESLARRQAIDLVVVGPEAPLAAGLADRLREAGLAVFGPGRAAARLESSKAYAKRFMARHAIPTASFAVFDRVEEARAYVRERGVACVVKADGLAAGKGVSVCGDAVSAERALEELMVQQRFGDAGARVVIEERLVGEEASFYAISDGQHVIPLAAAQDHKRALDGDRGENTGGMGAYSPTPVCGERVEKRVLEEIVHPTIRGLAAEETPYRGVLYVGLMVDADQTPRVVEFNVRFGDPETQPLLMRMDSDLAPLLLAAARGRLDAAPEPVWGEAAACVVIASGGYPRAYETGKPIRGIDAAEADPNVIVFHAGTRRGPSGGWVTAGGRVLGVTARGASIAQARERAYAGCARIRFEGMHLRRDIAARGVAS